MRLNDKNGLIASKRWAQLAAGFDETFLQHLSVRRAHLSNSALEDGLHALHAFQFARPADQYKATIIAAGGQTDPRQRADHAVLRPSQAAQDTAAACGNATGVRLAHDLPLGALSEFHYFL